MKEGHCDGCGRPRWVNQITLGGAIKGEFCEDCFDREPHDEPRRNRTTKGSGRNHNNPVFDDVIRALEEDR